MDDVESRAFALLAAGDDREAATAAIQAYGPSILGYVSRLLDGDDALDVFQQWAEDVWRGLPAFRRECRLRTWAFKLAYHAASRFRRDPYQARRERFPSSAASRLAASVAASSKMAGAARREQLRRLEAELTPDERALLHLRHDRELSWDETAEILSASDAGPVTAVALRKRYERIKEKLGRRAKAQGLLEG
ncbi:MAG TPA: sigma-70 family RNA polymerase sigma factor [Anaeromyxobacter sp.]|nr:sigma-70 family RNA polymerase sigma factor [Anaeromyxobacter sp.]